MDVFKIGEKIHVVEKRMFADDVRRHFIGEIIASSENAIRLKGYVWVYNSTQAKFFRRQELRERILILGDRLIINIIPKDSDIKEFVYNTDNTKKMFITNNKGYSLELSEFISF
jgi:hypothetical protein